MKRVLKARLRLTVIVTTKSRDSFRGVLYDFDDQAVAVRNVELLTPGAPTPVDGEVVVVWANVDTIQVV